VSDGYEILTLSEVEAFPHREGTNLIPVRHTLGFRPAGVNAWKADAGGQVMPPHEEDSGNEELYVVVQGRASFTVGEETADAPAGTLVFVPPQVFRSATAEEDGTIVFVAGGSIGEAFNAGGWEAFSIADWYRQEGRIDEARAIMAQLIAEQPDYWAVHYNAGCFESLAGNPDSAFEHLRRAKELDTEGASAEYFREDSDLDPLRDDPRLEELLG
jgi:mannose-6-phosphate isomerase-like protein (cupin superfamily)